MEFSMPIGRGLLLAAIFVSVSGCSLFGTGEPSKREIEQFKQNLDVGSYIFQSDNKSPSSEMTHRVFKVIHLDGDQVFAQPLFKTDGTPLEAAEYRRLQKDVVQEDVRELLLQGESLYSQQPDKERMAINAMLKQHPNVRYYLRCNGSWMKVFSGSRITQRGSLDYHSTSTTGTKPALMHMGHIAALTKPGATDQGICHAMSMMTSTSPLAQ